jgi:hypothetical protein
MKNKLLEKYREKVGEPKPNNKNQLQMDLWLLGAIDPQFAAAQAIDSLLHKRKEPDHDRTIQVQDAIVQQTQSFIDNPVQATTELLYAQVAVLNGQFNHCMTLSSVAGSMPLIFQLIDIALRCQEQCRKTLKTLNDIQNPQPKTVFIKNAIAQQVNQLAIQTEELQKRLEAQPYAAMDTRSQRDTAALNIQAEAVGVLDRGTKRGRKGRKRDECPQARVKVAPDEGDSSLADSIEARSSSPA